MDRYDPAMGFSSSGDSSRRLFSLFSFDLLDWADQWTKKRKKRKFDAVDDAFTEEKKIGKEEEEDGRVGLMELNPSSSSSPVVVIRLPIAFIPCWAGPGVVLRCRRQ